MAFFFGSAGFALGIVCAVYLPLGWHGALWFLCLGAVFFLFSIRLSVRPTSFLLGILFVTASFGAFRVAYLSEEVHSTKENTFTEVVGVVVDDPDVRETSVRLTIETQIDGEDTRVLVVAPPFPSVRYGETVRAEGVLTRPEAFSTNGDHVFHYDQFLKKDGTSFILERAHVEVVSPRRGVKDSLRGFFSDLNFKGTEALSIALPEPHASLAGGLLLGGKQGLGASLLESFIITGLVHIVVLSGYNVMIVAEAVYRSFRLFARRFAVPAAVATVGAFVLIAGAGSASVRAGLMAGIALFGRATGKTYDASRALCVALVAMLLWNPLLLTYDPGFQLSFIATLGLIFGAPIAERFLSFMHSPFLRSIIASTISAQIAVLPLLLYQNGLLSLVSLPANIVVLPLVPLAMALSTIALLGGLVIPAVAPFIALPAYFVLSFITTVTEFLASLPFSAVSVPAFPFVYVLLSYITLVLFVWWVSRHYVTYSK